MSILIKMEMPKSCAYCPCEHYECALMGDEHNGVDVTAYFEGDKRHPDCPIIEVPKHGRLIDERWLKDAMATTLEALIKNPKMDAQEMHIIAAFDTLREMIDDAPTIIESEE